MGPLNNCSYKLWEIPAETNLIRQRQEEDYENPIESKKRRIDSSDQEDVADEEEVDFKKNDYANSYFYDNKQMYIENCYGITRCKRREITYEMDTSLAEMLWNAAIEDDDDTMLELLERNPNINLEFTSLDGHNAGKTTLFFALDGLDEEIVEKIFEVSPGVNLDAGSLEGEDEGITCFWLAVAHASRGAYKWSFVEKMYDLNPNANINAMPISKDDIDAGASVLWLAANHKQWGLVYKMLTLNPLANLYSEPIEGEKAGVKVIDLILECQDESAELDKIKNLPIIIDKIDNRI